MEEQQMLKAASRTVSTCDLSFFSDRSRQNEKKKWQSAAVLTGTQGEACCCICMMFFITVSYRVKCFGEGDNLVYD